MAKKYMEAKLLKLFLITLIVLFSFSFIYAAECSDSGTIKRIIFSPNDLYLGTFNLTFKDYSTNVGSIFLYYPPSIEIVNGDNPANLSNDNGIGYYTWQLNASAIGNYTIIVEALYESPSCNVTRNITVKARPGQPILDLNFNIPNQIIADQQTSGTLTIDNIGNGTAYNINGYISLDNLNNIIHNFNILNLDAGNSTNVNFNIQNNYCASHALLAYATYEDANGYSSISQTNTNIDVVGAKLELTYARFYKGTNELSNGENVAEASTITLKANITNKGDYNALNVKLYVYEEGSLIKTINVGDIAVGDTVYAEDDFTLSEVGDNIELEVIAESDDDCSNNPYSTSYSVSIDVIAEDTGNGGGAGGGEAPSYVCGNQICETALGENYTVCPQDCKAPVTQPSKPQPTSNYIEIVSDDGLVTLKLNSRTIIKDSEGNRISIDEAKDKIKIEKVTDLTLLPTLPEGVYLVRAYKITPDISFDISAEIIFKYNAGELAEDASLFIYKFVGDWQKQEAVWDKENRQLIIQTYSASLYGLFTDKAPTPLITGAAIGEWIKANWWLALMALLAILIVIFAVMLVLKKKRK